jgi:hypothetical protein
MLSPSLSSITIRPAYADDASALARLAALDSAVVPEGPLMLAEVDGELLVALSTEDSTVIADPFHRTAELVELLRAHLRRSGPASRLQWRQRPAALLRRRLRMA